MENISFEPLDGLIKLGMAALLLIFVFILSWWKGLDLEKDVVVSSIRGFAQIMVLALVLSFIFNSNDMLLIIAILAAMIVAAGYTSANRAKELPDPLPITLFSILSGAGIIIAIMLFTGIMPNRPEFIIPLGGMAIGNSMNACSLALNRLIGEVKNNRSLIEASLSLGATSDIAVSPFIRTSIKAALIPTLDTLKTLGIITIPGAMTGLLMAGANPLWAAEYQVAIFFMILAAGVITTVIATAMSKSRLFSAAHQLILL